MKNCLIISPNFPPIGGVGVQRISKFVKYLPEYGWNPIIITIPIASGRKRIDDSMMSEFKHKPEIHRPYFFDYRKIVPGEIAKFFNLEENFLFPDKYITWNRFVIKKIKEIIKTVHIDLVFINSPPFSSIFTAKTIHDEFKLPVVVNLRDPFSFNSYNVLNENTKARNKAFIAEKEIFVRSEKIVVVTKVMLEEYKKLFPDISSRFELITNGFDEDDFKDLDLKQKYSDNLTIGYNGTFSKLAPLGVLLEAMETILNEHKIKISLNLATSTNIDKITKQYKTLFENDLINYKGFLPHSESVRNLTESNVLCALFTDSAATEGAYPGKVLEYLRMKRPVFLINNKKGILSELIKKTNTGVNADINDGDDIVLKLLEFNEQFKSRSFVYEPDYEEISKFEYKFLTDKLAYIFDNVKK